MLNESVLNKAFSSNAGNLPPASNDNGRVVRINRHDVPLVFFTPEQEAQLDAVVVPYQRAGMVTDIVLGKGGGSGYYNICNEQKTGYRTLLCATVEEVKDAPRKYHVNVGDMKLNVTTVNFSEVLRTVRRGLEVLFTEVPAKKAGLSPV